MQFDRERGDKSEFVIAVDEISSMSSVDSDNELWEKIETQKPERSAYKVQKRDSESVSNLSNTSRKKTRKTFLEDRSEKMYDDEKEKDQVVSYGGDTRTLIEKYEKRLEKMKENHRLEVQTISTSLQNKAKEMVATKIEEIKLKFETDLRAMMGQYVDAKSQVTERDRQINHLKELVKQQEDTILTYRKLLERAQVHYDDKHHTVIDVLFNKCKSKEAEEEGNAYSVLKNQIDNLESEVSSLKSLCNIYKRDELLAQKLYKEASEKLEDMEFYHKQEINRLIAEHDETIHRLKQENSQTQKQFRKYKFDTELEFNVLSTLTTKLKEANVKLVLSKDTRGEYKPSTTVIINNSHKKGKKKSGALNKTTQEINSPEKETQENEHHHQESIQPQMVLKKSSKIMEKKESGATSHSKKSGEVKTESTDKAPVRRGSSIVNLEYQNEEYAKDAVDESSKPTTAQTNLVMTRKNKNLQNEDPNSTFYSKGGDRSFLATPDSTKYGSMGTRPDTALDKSRLSYGYNQVE